MYTTPKDKAQLTKGVLDCIRKSLTLLEIQFCQYN